VRLPRLLNSCVICSFHLPSALFANGYGQNQSAPPYGASTSEVDQTRTALLETGRLFLRNLPFTTTSNELEGLFATYGTLEQVGLRPSTML
jgi:RNA recognition motif-containing protein